MLGVKGDSFRDATRLVSYDEHGEVKGRTTSMFQYKTLFEPVICIGNMGGTIALDLLAPRFFSSVICKTVPTGFLLLSYLLYVLFRHRRKNAFCRKTTYLVLRFMET